MKVDKCMCQDITSVKPDDTIRRCAKIMQNDNIGCLPVCDGNELVGIITDRDIILRAVAENKDTDKLTAKEIMTIKPYTCDCGCELEEAQKVMSEFQIRRIPIMENNKMVGILTLGDIALTDSDENPEQVSNTMKCICEDTKIN